MANPAQRVRRHIVKLVASSVVRGSHQGESHGGVYLVDFDKQSARQTVDFNTRDIDWRGHGGDRGLRGIAFDGDTIYVAGSDELFAYTPEFGLINSWRCPFLNHCHEIAVWDRVLYLTSTAYDSILGFDLDQKRFHWAMRVATQNFRFKAEIFDPMSNDGPLMINKLHINNVHCTKHGMYITGLNSGGMLHFNGEKINMAVELPPGTHNAQPFRDGVLFNDSKANALRYTGRSEDNEDRAMVMPTYESEVFQQRDAANDCGATAGFARGLCVVSERLVAGGSSPATIALHDLRANETLGSVNLSMDLRNAIHGLEVWPFN